MRDSFSAGPIPMPMYSDVMSECIRWILARPDVEIVVACDPEAAAEDKADLYGFACVESDVPYRKTKQTKEGKHYRVWRVTSQPVVHYVYVRDRWRGRGIARKLVKLSGVDLENPFFFTCKSSRFGEIREHARQGTFDPNLARYPKRKKPEA